MPFTSFRDRLGSTSKQERDLHTRSSARTSDGEQSISRTDTSSTTASNSSAALQALKTHPLSADPIQFIQDALTPIFMYNPKHDAYTLDDVHEYHVPRYFAPHYRHHFNLGEAGIEAWIERTRIIRENCKRTRIRFLKTLIDASDRQSMQHALVSLQYEIVVTLPDREDDVRIPGNGIYEIQHGQLTRAMVVMDLHEANIKVPEIPACVIA